MRHTGKVFAVAFAVTALCAAAALAQSQTAQSIMVNVVSDGTFAVAEHQVWAFDTVAASAYFSNAWDGNAPTSTCQGQGCVTPAPPGPGAPAPDPDAVAGGGRFGQNGVVGHNRCVFLDGGSLSGLAYTQSVQVSGGSGRTAYRYTYTYTYNVGPTVGSVDPFTAWVMVADNTDLAHVTSYLNVAGESVVVSRQFPSPGKFSFSLLDSLGSRVSPLDLTVSDGDGNVVYSATLGTTVSYPVDFFYTGNAGANGVAQAYLKNGDARTILNTDSHAGNDNGGADGSALAIATSDSFALDLGPGSYTVHVTGTVKGNGADASQAFDVTSTLTITTPGCGNGN